MATFGKYNATVVTRNQPCWIPGTAPTIEGPRMPTRVSSTRDMILE